MLSITDLRRYKKQIEILTMKCAKLEEADRFSRAQFLAISDLSVDKVDASKRRTIHLHEGLHKALEGAPAVQLSDLQKPLPQPTTAVQK